MKLACVFLAAAALAGCGTSPGFVKMAPDTYTLTRTDYGGIFGNTAVLKANVIREATEFAEGQGKVAAPVAIIETPVLPGRFASIEYQFRVLDKGDPAAYGVTLQQQPPPAPIQPRPIFVMPAAVVAPAVPFFPMPQPQQPVNCSAHRSGSYVNPTCQ